MPRSFPAVFAAALALAAGHAAAETDETAAAEIHPGAEIAAELCARCHDISPGGAFRQYPPSFAAIGVFRPASEIRWRIVTPPLHVSMPQMAWFLTPEAVDTMVDFIATLDPPPLPGAETDDAPAD